MSLDIKYMHIIGIWSSDGVCLASNFSFWQEVYDKQKELILTGERLLLATIGFDLNIQHPYQPLVAALKRLEISHNNLVRVAWNFVNDW